MRPARYFEFETPVLDPFKAVPAKSFSRLCYYCCSCSSSFRYRNKKLNLPYYVFKLNFAVAAVAVAVAGCRQKEIKLVCYGILNKINQFEQVSDLLTFQLKGYRRSINLLFKFKNLKFKMK